MLLQNHRCDPDGAKPIRARPTRDGPGFRFAPSGLCISASSHEGEGKRISRRTLVYSLVTRARHRDSKLSSASIRACASIGPLRFSVATLTGAATALACAGTAAGHFSNDFEITVLPVYQHFRPSIRRQDQCPCAFCGEALHCLIGALASAVSMPIVTSAEMQTAKKKTGRICIFIGHFPCDWLSAGSNFAFYSGDKRSKIWPAFTSKPSKRHLG